MLIVAASGDDNGKRGEPEWFRTDRGYRPHAEPGELYNLAEDLSQSRNRHADEPERVRELTALLERFVTEGRSTPGPKQANDVPVRWRPAAKPKP